jgi:NDP-sugar pyrophosphorylase family protein
MILLILAAGNGSRYGGPKQIDPFIKLKTGEKKTLLHFTLENASDYFDRFVFVIRKDISTEFNELFSDFMIKNNCEIIFQDKPLGTAYPVICASKNLDKNFSIVNADDYYGKECFADLNNYLKEKNTPTCMVGYKLSNTLTPNGKSNRGVCLVTKDGFLSKIEERKGLTYEDNINDDITIVSMNLFSFRKDDIKYFHQRYKSYSESDSREEFMLPKVVDYMLKYEKIKVVPTDDVWIGLTYKEDKPRVSEFIKKNHFFELIDHNLNQMT